MYIINHYTYLPRITFGSDGKDDGIVEDAQKACAARKTALNLRRTAEAYPAGSPFKTGPQVIQDAANTAEKRAKALEGQVKTKLNPN